MVDSAGGRTQLSLLAMTVVVLLVLLFLTTPVPTTSPRSGRAMGSIGPGARGAAEIGPRLPGRQPMGACRFDSVDTQPPSIIQAAFTIGGPYAIIDQKTAKQVDAGYQFRDTITKASGNQVATGVFFLGGYAGLSGLLCSRVDAVNQPEKMGAHFQLVPNPRARVGLPGAFRLKGRYFQIEHAEGNYAATPEHS